MQVTGLLAREAEVEVLGRLLRSARGRGESLVIRGAPGVGKTAVLDQLADQASALGWRVLRTDGTPSEMRLPCAALHKLLRSALGGLDRLPPLQRDALRAAFGLLDTPRPEIFLVALAALNLLTDLALVAPVAVLIDDTHWLDRSSAEVLTFVARRLEFDPLLLVATTRLVQEDPLTTSALPELTLGALDEPASSRLLDAAAPDLTAPNRRAILEAAAGNPLALLELPKALGQFGEGMMLPTLLPGLVPGLLPGLLPVTDRLERAFAARALDLPEATGDLLLLAALNDSSSVAEVVAAGEVLRAGRAGLADLDPAMAAGLVEVGPVNVRFRHPLVRSAIYQQATLSRRQDGHAAIAMVLDQEPDRRLWHRAASVLGTNEPIAAELEEAARRAERRGSVPGAVVALERAAELSPAGLMRGRRLLRGAELAHQIGRADLSSRLSQQAQLLPLSTSDRIRVQWIRELADEHMRGGVPRVQALLDLAAVARDGDDNKLAVQFLLRAGTRCWHLDHGSDVGRRVVAALDLLGLDELDPGRLVILAYAAPFEQGAEVPSLLARRPHRPGDDSGDLLLLGHAAACTGAFREAEQYCSAAANGLREQGRLAPLAQALSLLAWAALRRSKWHVALPAAEESARLAEETRQPIVQAAGLAAQAMIAGIRGEAAAAEGAAGLAEQLALADRNTIGLSIVQVARSMTAAGDGRPADAYEQIRRIFRPGDASHQQMQACWAIGSLAEVAVQSGHHDEAAQQLTRVEAMAGRATSPGVQVPLRYARALLAQPDQAETRFEEASAADLGDWPFEHGRLLLAYGGWLRRQQRVIESRAQLRAARDQFDRTGAQPWAQRARRELRAAGEGSTDPSTRAWDRLSPQELQIAQLVAGGLGNKEIGERLYISPRTVGSHLYRMFPKLDVTSRGQLAHALSSLPGLSTLPDPSA